MWLRCDLQTFGKTLIRQGWKPGLPKDKPSVWVFCPLRRELFPRDRVLIEVCENCEHFSGYVEKPWMPKVKMQRRANPFFSRLLELALKEKEKQDEEWWKKERELFGDERAEEA